MKGSESLLATAVAAGVQVCFANPGTTEIPLVEAFDQVTGLRAVLALSEGVVTGAADGHARMTGAPAMTLLHLGPGFANGIANLHNARRARTPLINLIGEHASWHQSADAPLTSDIESLAGPVSGWVGRTTSAASAAAEFAEAHRAARQQRLPATLIAAADHMWERGGAPADVLAVPGPPRVDDQQVTEVAKLLTSGGARPALLLGGSALGPEGVRTAARIAATAGGVVFAERSPARVDRTPGNPPVRPIPYFPEDVLRALDGFSHLVLVGARTPVSFFGYEGLPSFPVPDGVEVRTLADVDQDALDALRVLAEATGSAAGELPAPATPEVAVPEGALSVSEV
ncbi:acetolactate synthase large subunit, partial [Saccharopolyspora sp. NPDC000359]|uniref:acetolactate synthase large subunit n=1 Tax=Saccharopolyspora sp. NPDC000359 TaxID=3154251 RepID=UPI003316FDEF